MWPLVPGVSPSSFVTDLSARKLSHGNWFRHMNRRMFNISIIILNICSIFKVTFSRGKSQI